MKMRWIQWRVWKQFAARVGAIVDEILVVLTKDKSHEKRDSSVNMMPNTYTDRMF
jgi:hypothetical protein